MRLKKFVRFDNGRRNGGLIVKIKYIVLIEQGEDGAYIASVLAIKGCHTQQQRCRSF